MKIIAPLSLALDGAKPENLTLLGQQVRSGARRVQLHKEQWEQWRRQQKAGQLLTLETAPLAEWLNRLATVPVGEEVLLLHPAAPFDSADYNYLLQTALHTRGPIQRHALACYGHAAEYLTQVIAKVVREDRPSTGALSIFIAQLNQATRTYLLCRRSPALEPDQPRWRLWLSNLFRRHPIYAVKGEGWAGITLPTLLQEISAHLPHGALLWLDASAASHLRYLQQELDRRHFPSKQLRVQSLWHRSRPLPPALLWVTVTPDQTQIDRLRRQLHAGF